MMIAESQGYTGPWAQGGSATIRALTQQPYINGPDGIGGPFRGGCNILMQMAQFGSCPKTSTAA